MAGVKTTSYVDAIAREVRAENLADVRTALEAVEAELEHVRSDEDNDITDIRDAIGILLNRAEVIERIFKQLADRVEMLEKGRG